jgi:hypothetical protein
MANGGVYDGSGPRGGNKNVISRGGGNQNIAVRRPQRRKVKATADVRGIYANGLPPAHQLALHVLTNGQYGIIGQNERREFANTLGAKTASRKRITEDSVFWQPGRMGNRKGKMLPNYTKRLGQS